MFEVTEPTHAPPNPAPGRLSGSRRVVATILLTVGLFAIGGTAVALAADPSASPAPSTQTQPSDGGTAPSGQPPRANGHDCPNMGGSGGSGGNGGSSGSPATPNSSATPSV